MTLEEQGVCIDRGGRLTEGDRETEHSHAGAAGLQAASLSGTAVSPLRTGKGGVSLRERHESKTSSKTPRGRDGARKVHNGKHELVDWDHVFEEGSRLYGIVRARHKLREAGKESKNRCQQCGKPKRGHVCLARLQQNRSASAALGGAGGGGGGGAGGE